MNFYDPDVLLFLEAVNSEESPKEDTSHNASQKPASTSSRSVESHPSPDTGAARSQSLARLAGAGDGHHLSPVIDEDDFESTVGADTGKASALATRVRESIRRSRDGGAAMAVDVDLVEMLLRELEETKEKMKDLQTEYTAIRVRTAFS
jgi:hypothetical protein